RAGAFASAITRRPRIATPDPARNLTGTLARPPTRRGARGGSAAHRRMAARGGGTAPPSQLPSGTPTRPSGNRRPDGHTPPPPHPEGRSTTPLGPHRRSPRRDR